MVLLYSKSDNHKHHLISESFHHPRNKNIHTHKQSLSNIPFPTLANTNILSETSYWTEIKVKSRGKSWKTFGGTIGPSVVASLEDGPQGSPLPGCPTLCNVSRVPTIPALVHVISAVWHIPTLPFESLTHEKSSYFIVRTSGWQMERPTTGGTGASSTVNELGSRFCPSGALIGLQPQPIASLAPGEKLWARIIQLHSLRLNTQKLWDNQCFLF